LLQRRKLVVLIADELTYLHAKGELVNRYYNPGNLFDEVHILLTNADQVDPATVRFVVGKAKLHVHPLGDASFFSNLSPRFFFRLQAYVRRAVSLVQSIEPTLVRSYGGGLRGYIAAQAAEALGIPLVVSLHNHPDLDFRALTPWRPKWRRRAKLSLHRFLERATLRQADVVAAVYAPIVNYAQRMGARDVRVLYNVLNPDIVVRKSSYELHEPPRLLSVGRQVEAKTPEAIIRALAQLDHVTLTLVGMGPLHEHLKEVSLECGVASRVSFIPAILNDHLVSSLPEYDLFVAHNVYVGVAKAVLEPLLAGLPVIVSKRDGVPNPELDGDWVLAVNNTPDDYAVAIRDLLSNEPRRAALGRRAAAYAERFHPRITEQAYVDLYRELLSKTQRKASPSLKPRAGFMERL
jgi:glycosyltransferase involved in cell wall biosynthesis